MFRSTTQNEKLFSTLFEAAKTADLIQGSQHASAIVYRKQIIAIGLNSRKSHPLQRQFGGPEKIVLHSETAAIVKAINLHGSEILRHCSIWNLRLTKGGNVGNSKPCASCQKAIDAFGIKKVYWT